MGRFTSLIKPTTSPPVRAHRPPGTTTTLTLGPWQSITYQNCPLTRHADHRPRGQQPYPWTKLRDYASMRYKLHEFFADEFAMALLMPIPIFTQLYGMGLCSHELASAFSVPVIEVQRWANRLREHPDPENPLPLHGSL